MPEILLGEILTWSTERPAWQRDALRRIFSLGQLGPDDIEEVVALCKGDRGLSEAKRARPLTEEHLAIKGGGSDPVTIVSITHNHGVNALAPNQTLTFGANLTVVYGQNTAGKSGYTRILKRACRSRFTEEIWETS